MAFIPVQEEEAKTRLLQVAATTFTKGFAVVHDGSGQMTHATPGDGAALRYVVAETVGTTATAADLHVFWVAAGEVQFKADTTATPTQSQVGTYVDLVTNAGTLDTAASTDDLFFIEALFSSADNEVLGYFTPYTPNIQ